MIDILIIIKYCIKRTTFVTQNWHKLIFHTYNLHFYNQMYQQYEQKLA